MGSTRATIHEVDFCAEMASAINQFVERNPAAYPFREARVEGFGSGAAKRKRKDLRLVDHHGKLTLCGEVKLPGTPEGQSAVNNKVMEDAAAKADDAGVQYFFTWNVNEFALWDRSRWDQPWFERRVRIWRLPRVLTSPEDVAAKTTSNSSRRASSRTCWPTWRRFSPASGATGRCRPTTSSSVLWKAIWIGRCG